MDNTNAKLRGWMGENRVSGAKFAEMIEMPYPTFKTKIVGKSDWNMPEIMRILRVTGRSFEEIF